MPAQTRPPHLPPVIFHLQCLRFKLTLDRQFWLVKRYTHIPRDVAAVSHRFPISRRPATHSTKKSQNEDPLCGEFRLDPSGVAVFVLVVPVGGGGSVWESFKESRADEPWREDCLELLWEVCRRMQLRVQVLSAFAGTGRSEACGIFRGQMVQALSRTKKGLECEASAERRDLADLLGKTKSILAPHERLTLRSAGPRGVPNPRLVE